ncbi:MAG: CaiB/BaiF CoA transferase family protein [Chloroflexota bacterium]
MTEEYTEHGGPLAGIRVLDLSRVLAGPYCTMMLGDLGAEVIKVERPGSGDDTRAWGPPWAGGESAYYLSVNRNKKSLTLNLKDPEGQQIVRDLAARSDVVVENFKIGGLERMGIGYEQIRELNPSIVWATISGYGRSGPDAHRPGYDFVAQGEGGIMSITGEPDGEPMKVGVAIVDVTTGLYTAMTICAALREREISGEGQLIDTNLYSSAIGWLVNVGSNYLVSGKPARRYGNAHANIVPYQAFKARDQYMTVAVGTDRQFRELARIIGRPDLADDPRFATNSDRVENRDELIPILEAEFAKKDAGEWLEACQAAVIPSGLIQTIDQVFEHPQTLANNMVVETEHPTAGMLRLAGIPFELSRTPATVREAPPLLGEHTEEILTQVLDRSDEECVSLREQGII